MVGGNEVGVRDEEERMRTDTAGRTKICVEEFREIKRSSLTYKRNRHQISSKRRSPEMTVRRIQNRTEPYIFLLLENALNPERATSC